MVGIYCIKNNVNGKVYIGYSRNIRKRWDNHKYVLRRNTSKSPHLQNAWNIYGEKSFSFSILEELSPELTNQQCEEVETKWVKFFNSTKSEYGYNGVLPGTLPLRGVDDNKTNNSKEGLVIFVCVNSSSGEILRLKGRNNVHTHIGIPPKKVNDLADYWRGKGKRRSLNNWMIIRENDYDENFNYITSPKKSRKLKEEKKIRIRRKNPQDIIPIEQRNLKRVGVIAVNVLTGEERVYRMVKDTYTEFLRAKVTKCLNAPFGKYQHRGHYFKRVEE